MKEWLHVLLYNPVVHWRDRVHIWVQGFNNTGFLAVQPHRRELNKADLTMIKIRGIVLIALGIIMTLASIRQLFI
ncbi:hypothetical protein [Paenibacillus sp. JJ-100]|uniref:hypothetical protein n=1 Tax=Paenibacillus sp. JJ-100 TaxID=2974896 RepID=UPI0023304CE6|nr:hypothetical protein [Paenibacillus sp. JJ-100]